MIYRPQIAADPADAPRPTGKVKDIADILALHQTQVRRLVQTGELESHKIGKRGVRIYLDSVADYQQRTTRTSAAKPDVKPKPRRPAASTAAYRSAYAAMQAAGFLKRRPKP